MGMISISLLLICLIIGVVIGMVFMRYMSSFVFFKFEKIFDAQISQFQSNLESVSNNYLDVIKQQNMSSEKNLENLNHNLITVNNKVVDLFETVNKLNMTVNRVVDLENEIIKYKKIIKRLEKKHGLL